MAPQGHHQPRVLVGNPWDRDPLMSLATTKQLSECYREGEEIRCSILVVVIINGHGEVLIL